MVTEPRRSRGPSPQKTAQTREMRWRAPPWPLFIEQGYRGTRISDVAARAGVAKGTVYLHFGEQEGAVRRRPSATCWTSEWPPSKRRSRPRASRCGKFLSRVVSTTAGHGGGIAWLGLIRFGHDRGRESPEVAVYRQRVLDPLAAQIRHWRTTPPERGDIDSDAGRTFRCCYSRLAILATMWSGRSPDEPMNIAATLRAFSTWRSREAVGHMTLEKRIASAFGLDETGWARHANPMERLDPRHLPLPLFIAARVEPRMARLPVVDSHCVCGGSGSTCAPSARPKTIMRG